MESPYYEMTHDFEEENRIFQNGYFIGYHDAMLKEQQPKTGHWLKKMSSCPSAIAMGGSKISACDLCGGWGRKTFQYCPHCGAKMEKQP